MKPVYFILFTLLFTVGMPGCKKDIGNCPDALEYFDINGVDITVYNTVGNGYDEQLKSHDSAMFEGFYITCNYKVTYYSGLQNSFSFPSLFVNQAYALSCPENGYMGSKEGLESVTVLTKQDFNQFYPAGSNINDMILAADGFTTYVPLKDYVTDNGSSVRYNSVNIRLAKRPDNMAAPYGFTIIFKLKNGEEYTVQTPDVYFY